MKRLLPLGILLIVAVITTGLAVGFLWDTKRTATELPLRHKEATATIRLVYAFFQKRGEWPSSDEFQDMGLRHGLTKEWSYWCTPNDNRQSPIVLKYHARVARQLRGPLVRREAGVNSRSRRTILLPVRQ
jgi:hypothetical protein